jgi:hypothetical protein
MGKRVLAFGAIVGVFVATLLVILSILDLITMDELREALGKSVWVIVVSTVAVALVLAIGSLTKKP